MNNRIASKRRAEQREREERLQRQNLSATTNKTFDNKQSNGRGGKHSQQHRRDSIDSEDDEYDQHPGNYSPTSAMRNDQNQDEYEEPNGALGDTRRRSSLRSSSIIGIDGEETPGPTHTPFPLDGVAGADKSTGAEGT